MVIYYDTEKVVAGVASVGESFILEACVEVD
jgi:hypothetical protein